MENLGAFFEQFFPHEVAMVIPWLILALPVLEAALRLGEKIAKETQPTWDDEAVRQGFRVVRMIKLMFGARIGGGKS